MRDTGRDKFNRFKFLINFFVGFFKLLPSRFNFFLLVVFRHTGGIIGIAIRYILVKVLAKNCGMNVSIQPGVYLFNIDKISLGDNVSIHPLCYIEGAGSLIIGNNVSIAHNTSIMTTNHTWNDISLPIKYNKESSNQVIINDDVWIGCGVRILAGVTIESRVVVAAGAVVNKNVKSRALIGGVPAKFIKEI